MRVMDIMLAIPGFLMAIGIVALFGGGGLLQVMIAIGIVNIPIFARLMRGSILAQRENDYVLAARAVGVPQPDDPRVAHPPERDLAGDRGRRRSRSRPRSSTPPGSASSASARRIPRRRSGGRC